MSKLSAATQDVLDRHNGDTVSAIRWVMTATLEEWEDREVDEIAGTIHELQALVDHEMEEPYVHEDARIISMHPQHLGGDGRVVGVRVAYQHRGKYWTTMCEAPYERRQEHLTGAEALMTMMRQGGW